MEPMKPPKGLDATARALWRVVVADLEDRGVLRDADRAAIERYVIAEQVAREALDRIRGRELEVGGEAWLIQISHGGWGVHPDARIWRESSAAAASASADLGLSPRARRALRETSPEDELDRLIAEIER
jgi:P27 family predicted phage terminase small subunit